jgi:hypothetical protein
MRKRDITPTLLTAVAAIVTLGGCNHQNAQGQCIDQNGRILPYSYCTGSTGGGYYGGRTYIYPRRVYGGTVSGGRVMGGSSTAPSSGGIFRGGFGFHGGSRGGGG